MKNACIGANDSFGLDMVFVKRVSSSDGGQACVTLLSKSGEK